MVNEGGFHINAKLIKEELRVLLSNQGVGHLLEYGRLLE